MKKFSIKENAVQSLEEGVLYFENAKTDSSKIRLAILLIDNFVELFLKYYIQSHNPLLVFTKPSDPNSDTLKLKECLSMLKRLDVSIPDQQEKLLLDLRKNRNALNHFEAEISIDDWTKNLGHIFYDLIAFDDTNAKKFDFFTNISDEALQNIIYMKDFFEKYWNQAKEECEKHTKIEYVSFQEDLVCPKCDLSDVSYINDFNKAYCCFCRCDYTIKQCTRCGTWRCLQDFGDDDYGGQIDTCANCIDDLSAE